MAPRAPIPLREIVYTLSPYQQKVLVPASSKVPGKLLHFMSKQMHAAAIFAAILGAPIMYANWYKEQEKMDQRY